MKILVALAGVCLSAFAQSSSYPSSIASDSQLKVAANNLATSLRLSCSASDSVLTVGDGTRITAGMLLTIEREIVSVSSVSGNLLTVTRGYDNTTAATHAAGRVVAALIDAWHHNALAAEVKAIETALGPNLTNISASGVSVVSSAYNFPAQSPGGSLVIGSNAVTLAPVPRGVNGTDSAHYLYVSGGTGTAEACLIAGGAGTSGSGSGQVIINCANAHTGAWTISSATAGIQEALISIPTAAQSPPYGGGRVQVPAGYYLIHSTITIPRAFVSVYGAGRVATTLHTDYTGGPVFSVGAFDQDAVGDMDIEGPGTGSSFAFSVLGTGFLTERISISGLGQGYSVTGGAWGLIARDIVAVGLTGDGAYINTTVEGGTWDHILFAGSTGGSTGWHVRNSVGLNLRNVYTNTIGTGVWLDPLNTSTAIGVITMSDAYFDGYGAWSLYGVRISPEAGETVNTLVWRGGGALGFRYGVLIDGAGTVQDATFEALAINANSVAGGLLNYGKSITFRDCNMQANGNSTGAGLTILGGSGINILGGLYAAGSYASGVNTQTYGLYIQNTTDVRIADLIATPNITGPLIDAGGNTRLKISNVLGYNPVGMKAISPGSSPYTYTAGSSVETVYITGGTVSSIKRGSTTVAPASPAAVTLAPNTSLIVTYSVVPTMSADVQ